MLKYTMRFHIGSAHNNGSIFAVTPPTVVPIRDEMNTAEFNRVMETGLKQAKNNESFDVDEVFPELEGNA